MNGMTTAREHRATALREWFEDQQLPELLEKEEERLREWFEGQHLPELLEREEDEE